MLGLILNENNNFVTWSLEHGLVVTCFVLLGVFMIFYGKKTLTEDQQWQPLKVLGYTMSAVVIIWTILQALNGKFDYKADLPFLICNFMALTFPFFVHNRSKLLFEIIYFWILVATVQAIITPDLKNSFPHYHFIKFWVVHCGLVLALFYTIFVLGYRPYLKSIFKSFLALEIFIIIIFGINYLLDSNYMYLNSKPEFPTALDALGDHPWYIIRAHFVVFPVFFLFYLPFAIKDFINKRRMSKA